jgi:hypothetical protein
MQIGPNEEDGMKHFILAGAALAVLAMAQGPARAQYVAPTGHESDEHEHYRHSDSDDQVDRWDLDERIRWVQDRIERGREGGEVERDAAERGEDQLRDIRRDEERYRDRHYGRLPVLDRARLMARVDEIARDLRWHGDDNDFHRPWEDR